MKLDLHGLPIHSAWNLFSTKITDAYYMKYKSIVVITGQGVIMREFPNWVSTHPHAKSCISAPHNPGSFTVMLLK